MSLQQIASEDLRLSRSDLKLARLAQRQGKTLREIADAINAPLKSVEQCLYWDEVAK